MLPENLDSFFYWSGLIFWVAFVALIILAIVGAILLHVWYCACAFVFLVRRFRAFKHGGFDETYGSKPYLFLTRWFMYTFVPSWRLDYAESYSGKRVYWPFCGPDDWRKRTQWFEKIED
jgi:hypothetical protein